MPYLLPWRASVGVSTMRGSMRWSMGGLHLFAVIPLSGNGAARGFDPPRKAWGKACDRRARLDRRRRPAHIGRVTRTTTHAGGGRRISHPSPERARAMLIRHHFAEDLSDVVHIAGCRPRC